MIYLCTICSKEIEGLGVYGRPNLELCWECFLEYGEVRHADADCNKLMINADFLGDVEVPRNAFGDFVAYDELEDFWSWHS